jgi:hypothetical protein
VDGSLIRYMGGYSVEDMWNGTAAAAGEMGMGYGPEIPSIDPYTVTILVTQGLT